MSEYIIDATWDGEDDIELHDYLADEATVLSSDDILKLADVQKYQCIFAPTDIIQKLIPTKTIQSYYPEFSPFYNRDINVMTVKQFNKNNFSHDLFVKPYANDKSFNAMIMPKGTKILGLDNSKMIYVCEKVKFINEFRIFYGNNNIYGIVESSEYIEFVDKKDTLIDKIELDQFIGKLLIQVEKYFPNRYIVIDVGMTDNGDWRLVEFNPPFALSSYDLPIATYVKYCSDAWKSLFV